MARQPRVEYEGAFYHVTSRGNLKQNIFFEDADRKKFLDICKRTKERYSYFLHAYVLMENHYHLLIETPLANLSQLMQNINTSYTVFINRKYHRSGHLFQGRYKAIIVDKDNYLLSLSRYIHLNPVRARMVSSPEKYPWSSYREHIGYNYTGLVDINDTLAYFSEDIKTAMIEYKMFVESGIKDDNKPFKDIKAGLVLGRENFIEKIKEILRVRGANGESPGLKQFLKDIPIEEVVKTVADYYLMPPINLRRRSRKYTKGRKIAIYISRIATNMRNSEIGKYFGIGPQGVANILSEIENELAESNELRKEIDEIKCKMKV